MHRQSPYGLLGLVALLCTLFITHCQTTADTSNTFPLTATDSPVLPSPIPLVASPISPANVPDLPASPTPPPATPSTGNIWYISPQGNNTHGRDWANAWQELDQINWPQIKPGDTIMIDGGTESITYQTSLSIAQSGTADKPITIQLATEPGRNGQAIFFGGRNTPLPYCEQENYTFHEGLAVGVHLNDHKHIIFNGQKWSGIIIHGYRMGVALTSNSQNITLRYLEIYDNGIANQNDAGLWFPNGRGITLAGQNHRFERLLVHDNGQDAIQSVVGENNIHNLIIHESWLYNERRHPTRHNESFNVCTHTDGLQIYSGGDVENITVTQTIFGPGLTQSVVLGQAPYNDRGATQVNNVTFQDVLFLSAAGINIYGYRDIPSQNWTFDRVTIICAPTTNYTGQCINLEGGGHQMTNSIIMGSKNRFTAHETYNPWHLLANNCQYDNIDPHSGSQIQLGDNFRPEFEDVDWENPFHLGNFTQTETSPCHGRGSNLTSIQNLLNRP